MGGRENIILSVGLRDVREPGAARRTQCGAWGWSQCNERGAQTEMETERS